MFDNGCEYVFIIWDRMPKWGGSGRCADHIESLTANLRQAGVDLNKVRMCCIVSIRRSTCCPNREPVLTFGAKTHAK